MLSNTTATDRYVPTPRCRLNRLTPGRCSRPTRCDRSVHSHRVGREHRPGVSLFRRQRGVGTYRSVAVVLLSICRGQAQEGDCAAKNHARQASTVRTHSSTLSALRKLERRGKPRCLFLHPECSACSPDGQSYSRLAVERCRERGFGLILCTAGKGYRVCPLAPDAARQNQ